MKLKKLNEKKYEIITFLMLLITIPAYYRENSGVRRVAYAQYLADVNIGFNSHTFIGTVLNLFGKTVSVAKINIAGTVMSVITAFLVALLIGDIVRFYRTRSYNTAFSMIITALAVFSPFGIMFAYVLYGLVDIFWIACIVGSLLCLKRRWSRWLIPILSFIGIWIHYGYALAFLPFLTLILLYECAEKKHRAENIALCVVNTAVGYGFVAYCVFFARKFVKMSSTQALNYLSQKFTGEIADYDKDYILAFFYNIKKGEFQSKDTDILKGLFEFVKQYASTHYEYIVFFILLIPLIVLSVILIVKLVKGARGNAYKTFIRFCSFGIIIASLVALAISSDYYRFVAEGFVSLGLFITFLAYKEDEGLLKVQNDFYNLWQNNKAAIFIIVGCIGVSSASVFFA